MLGIGNEEMDYKARFLRKIDVKFVRQACKEDFQYKVLESLSIWFEMQKACQTIYLFIYQNNSLGSFFAFCDGKSNSALLKS